MTAWAAIATDSRLLLCVRRPPVDRAPPVPAGPPHIQHQREWLTLGARVYVCVCSCARGRGDLRALACACLVYCIRRVCLTDCALANRGAVAARRAASEGCS